MIADIVDLVWLVDAAISMGFLFCGGYLVIACFSVTDREKFAGIRLARRRPSDSLFVASGRGSVEPLRGETRIGHRITSDQRDAVASFGAVIKNRIALEGLRTARLRHQ